MKGIKANPDKIRAII
jgi:ribonuclease HI